MTVTKQQQLEYAAKHIEKWKSGYDYAVIEETTDGHLYVRWPSICTSGITNKEWQQERDKMQKQDVTINNQTSATIAATKTGDSEMTITAQDNSWHERGEFPPSGVECDIRHSCWSSEKYEKVTVAAITSEYVIVKYATFEQHYMLKDISFRPLRTEREKAIDEMSLLAIGCEKYAITQNAAKAVCELLYDSGCRMVKR